MFTLIRKSQLWVWVKHIKMKQRKNIFLYGRASILNLKGFNVKERRIDERSKYFMCAPHCRWRRLMKHEYLLRLNGHVLTWRLWQKIKVQKLKVKRWKNTLHWEKIKAGNAKNKESFWRYLKMQKKNNNFTVKQGYF